MTKIEWTDRTWNPIAGCSVLSPGCSHCYAMRMAARIQHMGGRGAKKYAGTTRDSKAGPVWTGKLTLDEDALLAPLRWRKPSRIFVNSMSDLFHEHVPDEWIDRIFAVMSMAPQHTFQVLTKRAERMRAYFAARQDGDPWAEAADSIADATGLVDHPVVLEPRDFPLPHVWLGVSVEDQRRADERIPLLLDTPAAVRWISAEPLLGPLGLRMLEPDDTTLIDALAGKRGWEQTDCARLDWIVAGGESGPGARPCHPDWIRSLRDQCATTGTPFFFKQWGSWYPTIDRDNDDPDWRRGWHTDGWKTRIVNLAGGFGFHGERVHMVERRSKRATGHLLDGREHREWPR